MNIVVNGHLLEFSDQGKGKVIVLLHGWGPNSTTFKELSALLVKKYRVITLDFPGFGGSPRPTTDWTVGDYADCVAGFLKKLDLPVYAFIGHSFGGRVIIKGTATGVLNAEKIVLIGSAGVKTARSVKTHLITAAAKTGKAVTSLPGLRQLRTKLRQQLYESIGSTDYMNAGDMKQTFLNTINEDLLPLVPKVNQPALLIWGENDDATPVRQAKQINDALPHGELVVIPGAGHFVYLEKLPEVYKELERFL